MGPGCCFQLKALTGCGTTALVAYMASAASGLPLCSLQLLHVTCSQAGWEQLISQRTHCILACPLKCQESFKQGAPHSAACCYRNRYYKAMIWHMPYLTTAYALATRFINEDWSKAAVIK